MKNQPECCSRGARTLPGPRGLCPTCRVKMRQARKGFSIDAALVAVEDSMETNPVGAVRLAAWALRREAAVPIETLRFHQGAGACAALLCAGVRR